MTQRKNSADNRLHYSSQRNLTNKRFATTLPAQSLCWLSSVSLLSGGFVFAQTESSIDNIVPTIENSQPTAVINPVKKATVAPETASTQPDFSQRRARLRQKLRQQAVSQSKEPFRQSKPQIQISEPVTPVRQSKPQIQISKPVTNVKPSTSQVETPQVSPTRVREQKPKTPLRTIPEKLPEVAQPSNNSNSAANSAANSPVNTTTEKTKDYNNAYIDPNNYGTDNTPTYQAPNSVILTNRSNGCRTVLPTGQNVSGNACTKVPPRNQTVANSSAKPAPTWLRRSENSQLAVVPPVRPVASNSSWQASNIGTNDVSKTAYSPNRFIPNPGEFNTTKVSATPIASSGGTLPPPMADGNLAPRPGIVDYNFSLASVLPRIPYTGAVAYNGTGMMYPLSIPAPITSLFGWRIHPITGVPRFHAGTDLGAAMGTPILAAAKGQVETANWVSGYGLTVILNHASAEQTLYGHMSEIFVQPGQWVEPGTVIGLVGSTGNSTGPHLHFEVRHLTQDGWVAADPSIELQTALNQLVQHLRTAQVSQSGG